MLLSIIKDSIILFLLIYALLNLAEKLCLFLSRISDSRDENVQKYYVIDISNIQSNQLEYTLRKALINCKDNVLLITEKADSETRIIIRNLCREFAGVYPVTRSKFQHITGTATELDAFFSADSRVDTNE